jgi:hypothetical protein
MALSTADLGKESGNGLPKTIAPGNHTLKINSLALEDFKFIPGAYHLILNLETEPIDGFEGFMINKDDASKGHYAGQIGRVKASQYAYADGKTKSGVEIERDKSILIFLQNLCRSLGFNNWMEQQNNKHNSIEEFVEAFNKEVLAKEMYLDMCIAGKEYEGKSGYTNYDMWLPKGVKGAYAYSPVGGKVLTYNESEHLKKLEIVNVQAFDDDDDLDIPNRVSTDFTLD